MKCLAIMLLAVGVAGLGGCDRARAPAAPGPASDGLHGHPTADDAVRTAIGRVRGIDADAGTLTVVLAKGRSREHSGGGAVQTLDATPAQLARVRVGQLVEFKWQRAQPRARLVAIDAHGHAGPAVP